MNHYKIDKKILIPYQLQYFAKEGPGGEKTEEPTTKKLQDARKEGQVAKSQELIMASSLIALFAVLKFLIGMIGDNFLKTFKESYSFISLYAKEEITIKVAHDLLGYMIITILIISIPVLLAAFAVAFLINYAQVKWEVSTKPLQPKLNKIDPVAGLKKMFSKDKIMELLKSILKIGIISYVVYDAMKDKWDIVLQLYDYDLNQAVAYIGTTVVDLGLKISILFLIIGLFDYLYQKFKFKNDMKMTKQEIKDEYKQTEGDPQIKGRIRQKMREASRQRMMQELPKADVVITNPTHLAVAIKYDREESAAPIVIAKGADYVASKIKEAAKEYKIEIVENKPLARMLYYNVDLGQEIPQELYQTVAEVLAYVYSLKNNN